MGYRSQSHEKHAHDAAEQIRRTLQIGDMQIPVGLILGTGWGDCLDFSDAREMSFEDIIGPGQLPHLDGHARRIVYGKLSGVPVIALRGRVHLNEMPGSANFQNIVRLQTEMLLHLGVKKLILTAAVGSLNDHVIFPGDLVLIDGFVTVFAPEMPLVAGEFCSPEDMIDQEKLRLIRSLFKVTSSNFFDKVKSGGHVMVRGPFFEGRKYDKAFLATSGASVVGMSILPEACVAALYPDVRIFPIGFVSNSAVDEHSHEENVRRAKESAKHLGGFLTEVTRLISK